MFKSVAQFYANDDEDYPSMWKTNLAVLVLLVLSTMGAAAADQPTAHWFLGESMQRFLRDVGFPVFVGVGMFTLFGWFLKSVMREFFNTVEESNQERKDVTVQFTEVLTTTLQNNTEAMTKTTVAMDKLHDAIESLSRANTEDHKSIVASLHKLTPNQNTPIAGGSGPPTALLSPAVPTGNHSNIGEPDGEH